MIIGKEKDIAVFAQKDFDSLIPVEGAGGSVQMTLNKRETYYLSNLKLARSLDFRPDGSVVNGIVLVLVSSASNWRNYLQWIGRVGRQGDPCLRIRVAPEIEAEKNIQYVRKLLEMEKELKGLGTEDAQKKLKGFLGSKE